MLLQLALYNVAFSATTVLSAKKASFTKKQNGFSTLINPSLEEGVKKPKNPINLSLLPFLYKNAEPTDSMGPELKVFNHADYVVVSINGAIHKNLHTDIDFWLKKYDKNNDKALFFLINSPGGYVFPVLEMQKNIDTRRLTTIVTGKALSAAVGLFLLGKQKVMFRSTKIGFHASSLGEEQLSTKKSFASNKFFLSHYENTQNKNKWFNFLLSVYHAGAFKSFKMIRYTAEQLLEKNLIQRLSTFNIIVDKSWAKPKSTHLSCKNLFL